MLELVRASSNVPGVCRGYWIAIWGFPWCARTVGGVPRIAGVSQGFLECDKGVGAAQECLGVSVVYKNFSRVPRIAGVSQGFLEYATSVSGLLDGDVDFSVV